MALQLHLQVCIRRCGFVAPTLCWTSQLEPKAGQAMRLRAAALSVNSHNPDLNRFLGDMSVNAIRRIPSAISMLAFGIRVANAQNPVPLSSKRVFPWFSLRGIALVLLLIGALQFAQAADVNARIKGVVTDPQGGALTGIQITATNEATGVKFDTVTGSDGGYLFPQLPVGTYTVSVAATGFKAFTAKGIVGLLGRPP